MLKGKKVILRALEKEDIPAARRFYNDYEVRRPLSPGGILPISLAEEEKIITAAMEGKDRDKNFNFAVTDFKGRYIGNCSYMNRNARNGVCWLGIAIADKKPGQRLRHRRHARAAATPLQ